MRRPLLLALTLLLLAPTGASADFDFTGSLVPQSLQAGGHPDVAIASTFTGSENPDRIVLRFPPGLLGNPRATPRCPATAFEAGTCDPSTSVGSVAGSAHLLLPVPVPLGGTVYNLEPRPGEPARLGIDVSLAGLGLGASRNQAAISLRPDGGLDSTITGIAASLPAGVKLDSLTITLDGTPGPTPFMTNPTSCIPATATLEAAPAGGATVRRTSTFTPTGCGAVPFHPSAGIALENQRSGAPSGYTVTLALPAAETPVRQSHVRRAEVVLPVGTTLSPPVATDLVACSDAQFAGGSCPAASRIGSLSFATPLIGTLGGTVSFGEPRGGVYRLFVEVNEGGVQLDLVGTVRLDPASGQITTVFDGLPQVPFTSFALSFRGGDRAVLANPQGCGPYAARARLTPWSGGAPETVSASFQIGGNASCARPPFQPSLKVGVRSALAGRPAGALTIDITRPDGHQGLRRVTTELPPGLAGGIAGVALCPEPQANAGTCPEASRLGTVSALVGAGAAPVPLSGRVYLTGPVDGSLVGMAIVLPGRVGPVDLGTVVTRAGIVLRPADGGLTVRTRPLPRFVGGVPVSIRRLALTLDRPGFITNSSSCAAQSVRAVLASDAGATATPTAPYRATDCAGLPFKPRLRATIGSARKPALKTVITVPPGHAATSRAVVTLPTDIGLDLTAFSAVCTIAQRAANACPEATRVGSAVARTPLLPVPLSGSVYVAEQPGEVLPGLAVELRGPVALGLTGTVGLIGGVTTEFAGIPDVPLARFELRFERALERRRNLCTGKVPRIRADMAGHNGAVARLRAPFRVRGCKPTAKLTLRRRGAFPTLRLQVKAARSRPGLRRVKLTLPRALRGHRGAGRIVARAGRRRLRAVKLGARTLSVRTRAARRITVTLARGAVTGSARKRRAFTVRTRDGKGRTAKLKVRARR